MRLNFLFVLYNTNPINFGIMENKRTLLSITDNPIYKDFFFKNDFVVNELEKYPTKWRRGEES